VVGEGRGKEESSGATIATGSSRDETNQDDAESRTHYMTICTSSSDLSRCYNPQTHNCQPIYLVAPGRGVPVDQLMSDERRSLKIGRTLARPGVVAGARCPDALVRIESQAFCDGYETVPR
jgi:hypothetical protein